MDTFDVEELAGFHVLSKGVLCTQFYGYGYGFNVLLG